MKQIDEYMNSLFLHVRNTPNVAELREEMKQHLIDSTQDFRDKGHSLEESINLAIDHFGEANKLINGLTESYIIRRTIAKWLLILSILFGLIGMVFTTAYQLWNENLSHKLILKYLNPINQSIQDNGNLNPLSQLPKIVDMNLGGITGYGYKILRVGQSNAEKTQYDAIYPNSITTNAQGQLKKMNSKNNLFIHEYPIGSYGIRTGDDRQINIELFQWKLTPFVANTGYLGLLSFWILFTVWALINLYHNRNLNLKWILLIGVFNIFGYWLYRDQTKFKHQRSSYTWIKLLIRLLGAYIIYVGFSVITFKDRGVNVNIQKLGIYIPLDTSHLILYGIGFSLIGFLIILVTFIFNTKISTRIRG